MSETGVVGEPEIEYTFLGIAVTTTSSSKGGTGTGSQAVVDEEKKKRSRRRTGAIARRLIKGVFKFPLCCRPSVHDDDDDDPYAVTEYSHHIPYAPRKVPEAMNQLVAYQKNKPDVRSQHLPHVARKANDESGQLQRKVIIYPPGSGSTLSMHGQWKIGFESSNRWESPLQAWSLSGDAYLGVGEPGLHFHRREDAIAYAQQYGWSYRVEGEVVKNKRQQSMGTFGWVELMRPAVKT